MSSEYTVFDGAIELRVLHGPQAGARLPLQPGHDYTIGAADTCAIVLSGAQVAQEHARISADENGIIVEALQGRVLGLDNQDVEPEPLPLGTVLQLGLVKLTVASSADAWPADESLQVRSAASEAVTEEAQELDEDAAEAAEVPAEVVVPHVDVEGDVQTGRRAAVRRYGAYAAVVLFAGVTAFGVLQRTTPEANATPTTPSEQAGQIVAPVGPAATEEEGAAALADVLKRFPPNALKVKRVAGGPWVVEGRLRTEAERQSLRSSVSALNLPVETKVMLESERLAELKRFVQARYAPGRLELRAEPGSGEVLQVRGAAANEEEATAFQEQARDELAALEPLEFDIMLPQQIRSLFMERLRDAGLGGKFKVLGSEPALELRAVLSPQETRTWETLFVDFTRRYGSALSINAHVEPERDAIAANVAAVVGGAFPYIVTTGGQRVAPGGVLAGRTVVAVRDGEIVLSDGTRFRYGL